MSYSTLTQPTVIWAFCLISLTTSLERNVAAATEPVVRVVPPVTWVRGDKAIVPKKGNEGFDVVNSNFKPYRLPGQNEDPIRIDPNAPPENIPGEPFSIRYMTRNQPIQSSDWWTSIGLQQEGWVAGRGLEQNDVAHSIPFYSEPFQFQFVDFGTNLFPSPIKPPHGLRIWNQNGISVSTDGKDEYDTIKRDAQSFNPSLNFAGRGAISPLHQSALTVGLDGIHPLKQGIPTDSPWTNVLVKSYSDWGVKVTYQDLGSEMQITMANGSPFVWFERTMGTAPFLLWTGGSPASTGGTAKLLFNKGSVLGLEITTTYNPFKGLHEAPSTAIYVVYANKGNWVIDQTSGTLSVYKNTDPGVSAIAVLAMPHNVSASEAESAAAELEPYACRKITDTRLEYPPAVKTTSINGRTLELGYVPEKSTIRSRLSVTTTRLSQFASCTEGKPLQMIFPHHRKALLQEQATRVIGTPPKYVWNTLLGQAYAYADNAIVQELKTYGLLPFFPSTALYSGMSAPLLPNGSTATEDIYDTVKKWFFLEGKTISPDGEAKIDSFNRNSATYVNAATNTYLNGTWSLREIMIIADQLAQTPSLNVLDAELGKTKQAVAAEIRDSVMETLKELIAQWGDIYTSQLFQYDTGINSFYGYPSGYGAVGSLNDHHFHYGYFLRAAAAIGRVDPEWLKRYQPLIEELRNDVANFDRKNTRYPFLRNFNPFYGHSWADGRAHAQNQESTSEAINFAVGLVELGSLLSNTSLRDQGLYLYEQEILATEQYFFNQCAGFLNTRPLHCAEPVVPPVTSIAYTGNWPSNFATYNYTALNGQTEEWHTTLLGRLYTDQLDRGTFFAPIDATFAIQQIPLSAHTLYLERSPEWLATTWEQYLRETKAFTDGGNSLSGTYEVIISGMQARLPDKGTDVNGTGLIPALKRIEQPHIFFSGAVDTLGKYWAYTHSALGQLDATVVANQPYYAVFKKGDTRTLVTYNPGSTAITTRFTEETTGNAIGSDVVTPARSMVVRTLTGSSHTEHLTPYAPSKKRLYLRADGHLDSQHGPWLPAVQKDMSSFPSNLDDILPSLAIVPVRDPNDKDRHDTGTPPDPVLYPGKVLSWVGRFNGQLIGATDQDCTPPSGFSKSGCDPTKTPQAITRMALYTDQCLYPGWQRCQTNESSGNTITVRVSYYFDTKKCDPVVGMTCTPDRVETYGNVALQANDNTFLGMNKITEYYFGGVNLSEPQLLGQPPKPAVSGGFNGTFYLGLVGGGARSDVAALPIGTCLPAPCAFWSDPNNGVKLGVGGVFPKTVENGAMMLQLYGGSPGPNNIMRDIPVSVDTNPVLGRASWIQPPYE